MLSASEVASFVAEGYVAIRSAVPADTVQACREMIWSELAKQGVTEHDPATWTEPVVRISCPEGAPFADAGTRPVLWEAFDQLIGQGRWWRRFVPDRWGWELPGGLVDEGEEPAAAANRELAEETGYRAGQLEHLVTFQPIPGTVDAEHYVYTGRDPRRVGDPTDPAEAARVEWVPLTSIPALIAAGEIWSAGSVAALPLLLMQARR